MKQQNYSRRKEVSREEPSNGKTNLLLLVIAVLLLLIIIVLFNKDALAGIIKPLNGNSQASAENPIIERVDEPSFEMSLEDALDPDEFLAVEDENIENQNEEVDEAMSDVADSQSIRTPLYFLKTVGDESSIVTGAIRNIHYSDLPLAASIKQLLLKPNAMEMNNGFFTLIPENSVLLSIEVTDKIAYLNFNEDFQFNSLGREGYLAQVKQIVYTATEIEGVDKVQILIEGKRLEFLGADGIYIGEPLSREDLDI